MPRGVRREVSPRRRPTAHPGEPERSGAEVLKGLRSGAGRGRPFPEDRIEHDPVQADPDEVPREEQDFCAGHRRKHPCDGERQEHDRHDRRKRPAPTGAATSRRPRPRGRRHPARAPGGRSISGEPSFGRSPSARTGSEPPTLTRRPPTASRSGWQAVSRRSSMPLLNPPG